MTMAADVAADTNFIAYSRASIEALKSANLLKNLNLNAIIVGEEGVGKTTLAKTIAQTNLVDCTNLSEVTKAINENQTLILKNFSRYNSVSSLASFRIFLS